MKFLKSTLFATILLTASLTFAQEETTKDAPVEEITAEEPTFNISGSIDTYAKKCSEYAPGTSFGNLPGFALGMANVMLSYEGEKSGFVADLVFGPRGNDAVFGSATFIDDNGDLIAKGSIQLLINCMRTTILVIVLL